MNILFVHQNFPAQYRHLAGHLAKDKSNRVVAISKRRENLVPGAANVVYPAPRAPKATTHPYLAGFEKAVLHGQAAARTGLRLKARGFRPDAICVHPGWGEALYLRDVYPDVPQLHYCEFFHRAFGAAAHFAPHDRPTLDSVSQVRVRNLVSLFSLEACDWGVSPTRWQRGLYPEAFRAKISEIHDGIDTRVCAPDARARLNLAEGVRLTKGDEVVTYVARGLEPIRGFPTFMRAVERLCRRRPRCHVVIVGADEVRYGGALPAGQTYRERMLSEVDVDPARVHFPGRVPYGTYLRLLQVSSVHVYLTVPFVLSWSMLEAMAAGCVVVGSNTAPVTEVLEDRRNGLLVDFFSPEDIAERVEEVLDHPERMRDLGARARQTVVERYDVRVCLPAQLKLLNRLIGGRRPDR